MESILNYVSRLDLQPLLSKVTRFEITALPEDCLGSPDKSSWVVTVELRGDDRWGWAVMHHSEAYDKNLKSEYESLPSARTKKFKKNFRHSLPEAIAIAEQLAPTLNLMGMSVDQFAVWYREKVKSLETQK